MRPLKTIGIAHNYCALSRKTFQEHTMNTLVRLNNCLDSPAAVFPRRLDDLLNGFFSPVASEARTGVAPIKIEVTEDPASYHVSAVIAGVKKEDIHVEVDQNEISIVAEIKRETAAPIEAGKDGQRMLHSERFYGKTSRVFSVAQHIDEAAVQAKYADGVLSLVLPKKVPVTAKRVTIA
jgi:HSP20 family protein